MRFQVILTPSADEDLKHYRAFEQRAILEGEACVKVVAVGHKEHNDLFIRGKAVDL